MAVVGFIMTSPAGVTDQIPHPGFWTYDDMNYSQQSASAQHASAYQASTTQQATICWQVPAEKAKNNQREKKSKKNAAVQNPCTQLPTDQWTTICFRNVPNIYNNTAILNLLDVHGFKDDYNFIYVPHDFKRLPVLANLGYIFVNFASHEAALRAWEKFDGFNNWEPASHKVLAPSWATQTQGLHACIEKYQKSPVMHEDVPIECKPLLIENGTAAPLAPGKHHIKAPRLKTVTPHAYQAYHGHAIASALETANEDATGTTCSSYKTDVCDDSFSTAVAEGGSDHDETSSGADDTSFGTTASVGADAVQAKPSLTWMPDDAVDSCLRCDMPFSFLRRRHHCRSCGLIFCAECAPRASKDRLLKRAEAAPYKRLCVDCTDGMQGQSADESALVVKNTFVTFPRTASVEDHFSKKTTSFPL